MIYEFKAIIAIPGYKEDSEKFYSTFDKLDEQSWWNSESSNL
jgi:hypothetical protein